VLEGPLDGVTRVVVRHERRSAFRWFSLVELCLLVVFLLVFMVCLAVALVLMLLGGGGGGGGFGGGGDDGSDLPLSVRFFRYWQELVIRLEDKDQQVVGEVRHQPRDKAEGQAVVSAVLAAAHARGVVVVETLGGAAAETLEVWFGGQPLLAHPDMRDAAACRSALERAGYTVEEAADGVHIRLQDRAVGWLGGILGLIFDVFIFPFSFWKGWFWAGVRSSWQDIRGVPPETWTLTVHAQRRLSTQRERAGRVTPGLDLDARDVLGIAYSPWLDFDPKVTRRLPSLRVLTRDEAHTLPDPPTPPAGRALRDLILLHAIERWEGVPAVVTRPTRCPYCGTLYVLASEASCPSCGASAGVLG
jgi:hypothetical protein